MALTINLLSPTGVNFNADYTNFFAEFTPTGFPFILGGATMYSGDQLVLLDEEVAGNPSATPTIIVDGPLVDYHFASHTLSGTMTSIRLATLGSSYNAMTGTFTRDAAGHIANVNTSIEITGLNITNPSGGTGAFHDTVLGLMGGGHGATGSSNPTALNGFLWAEGHIVNGSAGADTYTGTRFADTIRGNGGNDVLHGGAGNDLIDGGLGADQMRGGVGNDIFVVDNAGDRVIEAANQGTDTVRSTITYSLTVNVERLELLGNAAINGNGNALDNILTGNAAANVLNGGAGADTMRGGAGADTYVVDNAGDRVVEAAAAGIDTVRASVSHTLAGNVENLQLTGNAVIDGTGNVLANAIAGNGAANVLTGNGGNDVLNGGGGNDTIYGGVGDDRIIGGVGADHLYGGTGADVFVFSALNESRNNAAGRDTIFDFQGAQGDRIDLSAIDANTAVAGDQAFTFIGTAAFGGSAGQLRYQVVANQTYVQGDVNGDGVADFAIHSDDNIAFVANWFVL